MRLIVYYRWIYWTVWDIGNSDVVIMKHILKFIYVSLNILREISEVDVDAPSATSTLGCAGRSQTRRCSNEVTVHIDNQLERHLRPVCFHLP